MQGAWRSARVALERVRVVDEPAALALEEYVFLLRQEAGRRRIEARELRVALEEGRAA
ncbi:hypothetical protein GCM10009543_22310 [Leifsonia naganoensis]